VRFEGEFRSALGRGPLGTDEPAETGVDCWGGDFGCSAARVNERQMSFNSSIAAVCNRVEAMALRAKTGVCIASPDRRRLVKSVFPNLPETFQSSIKDLPTGPPYIGSCTAAMDGNTVITSQDLSTDTRFSEFFVNLCIQHGVRSLQSRPVYGREGRPIGTFVLGYAQPRELRDFDGALMEFAADAVGALLQEELDRRLLS